MTTWSPPPLPSHFADSGHPSFVGRRTELESLEHIWEAVEKGERQAVFLGGEPGSGKSRIAAVVARSLHELESTVLLGANSPDLSYPYEPLVDAMNQLLTGTDEGSLAHLIPDSAAELLRVTPHLHRHRPELVAPSPSRDEYRRELFGAFVDLLVALAADRPVALVIEDLHWSSSPTRQLVSHIVQSTQGVRLLILATWRNTTPDRSEDLSFAIADLHRLPGVSRIDLSGLGQDDIEEYLQAELGEATPEIRESAALLRDQTGGNPFFLREVWRDVALGGGIQALRSRRLAVPHTVRDSLQKRIRAFGSLTRTVLELAAVLGLEFPASDVIEIAKEPAGATLAALDEAVAAGLLRALAAGMYTFQHPLIREALIEGLPPSQSAEIHAQAAEALALRYESEPDLAPILARLYEGASALGFREELVHYLCESAERARRSLAHEEAAGLWEQAARTSRDIHGREVLLLSAGRAHLLAGDFPQARRIYKELNGSNDPEIALRSGIGFEEASWRPGTLGHEARLMLEQSLDRIPADPTNPLYVQGLISLSRAHTFSGELDVAGRIGKEGLAMARSLGDESLIAGGLAVGLLLAATLPIGTEDISALAGELREVVLRTGEYDHLGPAGATKASAAYLRGDLRGFREGWSDVHLAAEKTGQPFWQWVDGCYRASDQFMRGDFDTAIETVAEMKELGYAFDTDGAGGPFGLQMYMINREIGGLEMARALISGDPTRDGTWVPGLLSLYTELEMESAARTLLPVARAVLDTTPDRVAIFPAVLAFVVEAALYLRDVTTVEELLAPVLRYEGLNLVVGQSVAVLGSASSYLGRMYALLGDYEEADRQFRLGLKCDAAIGSTVHQATTLAHYAAFLATTGKEELAIEYRTLARGLAEPIGQERVLRILDSADGPSNPFALTEREIDVLRLLAEGKSNKQIGDRLFISPNTAANHVRNILAKTDSPNRTAAATFAADHGLT